MIILGIALVALGEGLAIFSELLSCHDISKSNIINMLILITIAGFPLIFGYIILYKEFGNIWAVSVCSVTSILVSEPILVYAVFREPPSYGAIVGMILGAIGFACALTF